VQNKSLVEMKIPSKSPDRNTFQKNAYLERCKEEGVEPNADYLQLYESDSAADNAWAASNEHDNDLEWDLRTNAAILAKVRSSESYAQNLYAAMCNNKFQRNDVWPVLKDQTWACTWRSAGGIIADMREEGDYIDWYCSGIGGPTGGGSEYDPELEKALLARQNFVPESTVTDEIRADLYSIGWTVRPYEDED